MFAGTATLKADGVEYVITGVGTLVINGTEIMDICRLLDEIASTED